MVLEQLGGSRVSGLSDFLLLVMIIFLSAIPVFWGVFGQGTGPTFLNDVVCTGTEPSLLSCSHREIGTTSCSHEFDIGVVCPPGKLYIGEGSPYCLSELSDAKRGRGNGP